MTHYTNIQPDELNYNHYSASKYDRDIVNSIPCHKELHQKIISFMKKNSFADKNYSVLDLGVGTGITTKIIRDILPNATFDVVDFSKTMLAGAQKKLGKKNVHYILGDYAHMRFKKRYDIIISVIGIHHQTHAGKKKLFKKIYSLLNDGGIFIFGDLVTYKNEEIAALNQALHFHHLVEKSTDQKTLRDWAYHHLFLNDLAPVEDQLAWLKECGFATKILLLKINTALIIGQKNN